MYARKAIFSAISTADDLRQAFAHAKSDTVYVPDYIPGADAPTYCACVAFACKGASRECHITRKAAAIQK